MTTVEVLLCLALKRSLERFAADAGLPTKSSAAPEGEFVVCNRIAVEELESWLLGDEEALRAAFPRLRPFSARAAYRDPDAIAGGTWEALERLLKRSGYYSAGLAKVECATSVARYVKPERNRSHSFGVFIEGLRCLVSS